MMKSGAQLYTVREFCKTFGSLTETLKKIADIGYEYVQVSGICEYDPSELAKVLRQIGLKCVLTHIDPERISENTENVIAEHNILECKNIGIGYYEVHKEGISAFYDKFSAAGELMHKSGKRLCYHNHDHEFIKLNGEPVLKQLADKFTAEQLSFTPDTYWIQAGGASPAAWIKYLKGRVPCVHLKDMEYGRKMAALGEGNLDLDGIISECEASGTEYLLVEQDDCYGKDPFECLKTSYDFLRSRGF